MYSFNCHAAKAIWNTLQSWTELIWGKNLVSVCINKHNIFFRLLQKINLWTVNTSSNQIYSLFVFGYKTYLWHVTMFWTSTQYFNTMVLGLHFFLYQQFCAGRAVTRSSLKREEARDSNLGPVKSDTALPTALPKNKIVWLYSPINLTTN